MLLSSMADGKKQIFWHNSLHKKTPDFVPHPLNRWSLFLHPLNLILTALANGALANTVQAVVSKVLVHQGLPSLAALNHFPAI